VLHHREGPLQARIAVAGRNKQQRGPGRIRHRQTRGRQARDAVRQCLDFGASAAQFAPAPQHQLGRLAIQGGEIGLHPLAHERTE